MVLDDEIQQVCGLGFDTGVGRCAEYALVEIAQQGGKGIATLASEQIGGFATGDQIGLGKR